MFNKESLITNARSWLNVPWKHGQRDKNIGVDCVNFLFAVGEDTGLVLPPFPDKYSPIARGTEILDYLSANFTQVDEIEPADILLIKFSGYNTHVAIATSPTTMIHACLRRKRVVEHAIDDVWRRTIDSIWEIELQL